MDRPQLRTAIAGFVGGGVVLAFLIAFVGSDRVFAVLSTADPWLVAAVAGVAVAWLAAWGMALYLVLVALDTAPAVRVTVPVYAGVACLNNVTPFGQAGGEPLSALLIARVAKTRYETGLAAAASVDVINVLPSVALALASLGYLATVTTFGRQLTVVTVTIGVLAAVVVTGLAVGWRLRNDLEGALVRGIEGLFDRLARFLPDRFVPSEAGVEHRVGNFFGSIERVGTTRHTLAGAVSFSAIGWGFRMTSLWLAFAALDASVPVSVVLVVVPVANLAGVTPLPGGLGSIDATMVGLLVPLAGVSAEVATAAVLIHRLAVYWLPVALGGVVLVAAGMVGPRGP